MAQRRPHPGVRRLHAGDRQERHGRRRQGGQRPARVRQDVRRDDGTVNENLPAAAVEEGVKHHITTLKTVVDAQKAKHLSAGLLVAAHGVQAHGRVRDDTDRRDGEEVPATRSKVSATSADAGLQAGLTSLLREHVLLASSATGAALRGDTAQLQRAAAALNGPANSNTASIVGRGRQRLRRRGEDGVRRSVAQRRSHPRVRRLHAGCRGRRHSREPRRRSTICSRTPRPSARR